MKNNKIMCKAYNQYAQKTPVSMYSLKANDEKLFNYIKKLQDKISKLETEINELTIKVNKIVNEDE